jgi:hypothetical protein
VVFGDRLVVGVFVVADSGKRDPAPGCRKRLSRQPGCRKSEVRISSQFLTCAIKRRGTKYRTNAELSKMPPYFPMKKGGLRRPFETNRNRVYSE